MSVLAFDVEDIFSEGSFSVDRSELRQDCGQYGSITLQLCYAGKGIEYFLSWKYLPYLLLGMIFLYFQWKLSQIQDSIFKKFEKELNRK